MKNYKKNHYYKCKDMFIMSRSNYGKFEKCYEFPEIPQRIKRREIPRGATVLMTWLVPLNLDDKTGLYMRNPANEYLIHNWKG